MNLKKLGINLSLISCALLTGCNATQHYTSTLTEGMDSNISPRQDFYHYVNGKWENSTTIPADRTSWGTLAELNELNEKRSLTLLQAVISDPKFANDPKAQHIKAIFETYTDLNAREKAGLTPVKADLDKIQAIRTLADLEHYIINETKQGNDPLFSWGVFAHLKHSRQNAVYLGNEDLGLSNDYYQKDTPENRQILAEYQDYVAKILEKAGLDNVKARSKAIVNYEKAIAKTLFTNEEERDIQKRYNPISTQNLAKLSKNFNLANYLQAVGVKTDDVILWEPRYFRAFDSLINVQNLAVIKDYMIFRTLSGASPYLNKEMDELHFNFYGKTLTGQKQQRSLEKRALSTVNSWIGQDFAQFYVEEFFPETSKRNLLEMAQYLIKAYHHRIDNLSWMSLETKQKAKAKLDKFLTEVGYPNKWKDYGSLQLKTVEQGGTLYANMQEIAKWNYQYSLNKVGKAVDLNEWGMLPQVVNASYSPLMNRIVFPAGILQSPIYDVNADPAVNFGSIGAIIGHEITHGFDDSGSKFDGEGNLTDWWTIKDRQQFEQLADKLVAQFNQFEVAPNVHVNGRFTLGENIADLGGLSIAYDALKLFEQDKGKSPVLENLTSDQRFFMSWTRSWRYKATVEALTHQVKSDPHAPGHFRAFAPVLNIQGFHQAFGTQQGDKMYRSPEKQIRIW